jgi:hypothetical protein
MKINRLILTLIIILLTSAQASAATVNWNISGTGLWSESAKWSPVKVPVAGDDVFINNTGTGTITVDTTVASRTLTVGGAKKITLSTGQLTISSRWLTAALIETEDLGNAQSPHVAIDASGNAVAVWEQDDGTRYNIWSNRYTASTGLWGTAAKIETDITGDARSPEVAIDAAGNAVAVWYQWDGTYNNLWSNRYTASTGLWGTEELIETNKGDVYTHQVASDASGNAVAVWTQHDGTYYNIYSNRYTASTELWGTAALIETGTGDAYVSQVAIDADGNAIAVWVQNDGTYYHIWYNRYTASTELWGTAALIETNVTEDASSARIAFDTSGNALAVWHQGVSGANTNIYSNRYTESTGLWGTAALIETGSGQAVSPEVAVDASGNALAVWVQHDGIRRNIYSNRYTASTELWGTAALIETDDGEPSRPQVAIDASGNAVAVWGQQDDGPRYNIWSNRYTASTGLWGTAVLIETDDAGDAYEPQVAIDASGNAVAVWHQWDGSHYNVWSNLYR